MTINKHILYNNLIHLTRNKSIYESFTKNDTFNDRLVIFLFHLCFFFNHFNTKENKEFLQNFFDYSFKQLEISIREIGYGDVSVNKKMKEYINYFYFVVDKTKNWKEIDKLEKSKIVKSILIIDNNSHKIVDYIDKYRFFLTNNSLNSLSKSVIDVQI